MNTEQFLIFLLCLILSMVAIRQAYMDDRRSVRIFTLVAAVLLLAFALSVAMAANNAPPAPPYIVDVQAGNGQATIIFTPSENATSYSVETIPGNTLTTGTSSPIVVTGLTNGTLYSFNVYATNTFGTSAPTGSIEIQPEAAAPSPPTNVSATYNSDSIMVAFDAPLNANQYTAIAFPGNFMVHGYYSPIVFNTLPHSVTYTFTVTASNGAGTSAASATSNPIYFP